MHATCAEHHADSVTEKLTTSGAWRRSPPEAIALSWIYMHMYLHRNRQINPRAGASIPIYQWRQMRHGQFWGESIKSLILSFNVQQYEFCAQNIFALYSLSCHFLKNFLARCARSIPFYLPLRNESMQCALPIPTPFIFYRFLKGHDP